MDLFTIEASMLTYGNRWFRGKKRIIEQWEESHACEVHSSRGTYVVVVGQNERSFCFIEISKEAVTVGFLDDLIREYLTYSFRELSPGKLFLKSARHRNFEGESDKLKTAKIFYFETDGRVHIEEYDDKTQTVESSDAESVDPAGYWEDYPEFGKYDSLIRIER
ncbi:MAG: hypothetical protein KDA68_11355 [Planctomycetaceae bacterium]|nr:hypothetical protein [Planctomycetaceae bacterium]